MTNEQGKFEDRVSNLLLRILFVFRHHWAYRYTVSGGSRIRQVFIDGVVHGPNSASGDLNSPAGKPWHLGGRADNGLENKFEGDLDELMVSMTYRLMVCVCVCVCDWQRKMISSRLRG